MEISVQNVFDLHNHGVDMEWNDRINMKELDRDFAHGEIVRELVVSSSPAWCRNWIANSSRQIRLAHYKL